MNKSIVHKAIDYLARREHSAKELVEKLAQKNYEYTEIEEVLQYLQRENYQSDERYAQSYSRGRIAKGYGWLYIKNGLIFHHINNDIINQMYEYDEIDWYLQAERTYNKRFGGHDIVDVKDKAKRVRFLQSRGFSMDQIMAVVKP